MDTMGAFLANNSISAGIFNSIGLPRLALHWPRALASAVVFEGIFRLIVLISPLMLSSAWGRMNKLKRYKWCVRVPSVVHAAYMVTRARVIIANTRLRSNPVHGIDLDAESAYAVTLGYFLWDIVNTYSNMDMNSWGFMVHAVMSFSVYLLSYAPLLQYYGACFMMFEVSTIFLNIHLSMEDLDMKDYILYYINGMALVSSFFFSRIVYGTILSFNVWRELAASAIPINPLVANTIKLANIVLMGLSYHWFGVVIMTAKRSALDAGLIRAVEEMDQREKKTRIE